MCLLFCIHDLRSLANSVYEYERIHNRFTGSIRIYHSIPNTDTLSPLVSGIDWMLPQFYRYIGTGSERPDTDATLHEYGDQSLGSTVLASFRRLGYLLSCLDECSIRKHAWRFYFGIYKFYNYIPWQFPDLSPTGCGVQ